MNDIDLMIDCVIVWLSDYVIEWLSDCVIELLSDWVIAWLIDWVRVNDYFNERKSDYWMNERLINWNSETDSLFFLILTSLLVVVWNKTMNDIEIVIDCIDEWLCDWVIV